MRIQATWCHFVLFEQPDVWESPAYDRCYPFKRRKVLGDLCHVPDKTGGGTLAVIEKQLGRLGMTRYDVVSGTGDGGGENEGSAGIHALL